MPGVDPPLPEKSVLTPDTLHFPDFSVDGGECLQPFVMRFPRPLTPRGLGVALVFDLLLA